MDSSKQEVKIYFIKYILYINSCFVFIRIKNKLKKTKVLADCKDAIRQKISNGVFKL